MPLLSICNDAFRLDDPHVVDPRLNTPQVGIERGQLPDVIAECFAEPLDFPPIPQVVLLEDSIAIAVEPDTPCGLEIANHVAARFIEQGNDSSRIKIVCTEKPTSKVVADVVVHDPTDSEQKAYLLADQQGVPFYINRTLLEADIVIPIGTGDGGRNRNSLCPSFCDIETRKYVGKLPSDQALAASRMVDSSLGIFWQIRIVTAPGDQVLKVLVGSSESVLEKSAELGNQVWNIQVDQMADMVLATIESSCGQTWKNVRKAILNADKVATEDAVIVLCTELHGKPPSTWPPLTSHHASDRKNKKDAALEDVFQRRHVYLASRLTRDSTEKMGFGHLENSEQIQKLIDQHESCLLLRDAHRLKIQKKDEE